MYSIQIEKVCGLQDPLGAKQHPFRFFNSHETWSLAKSRQQGNITGGQSEARLTHHSFQAILLFTTGRPEKVIPGTAFCSPGWDAFTQLHASDNLASCSWDRSPNEFSCKSSREQFPAVSILIPIKTSSALTLTLEYLIALFPSQPVPHAIPQSFWQTENRWAASH